MGEKFGLNPLWEKEVTSISPYQRHEILFRSQNCSRPLLIKNDQKELEFGLMLMNKES